MSSSECCLPPLVRVSHWPRVYHLGRLDWTSRESQESARLCCPRSRIGRACHHSWHFCAFKELNAGTYAYFRSLYPTWELGLQSRGLIIQQVLSSPTKLSPFRNWNL